MWKNAYWFTNVKDLFHMTVRWLCKSESRINANLSIAKKYLPKKNNKYFQANQKHPTWSFLAGQCLYFAVNDHLKFAFFSWFCLVEHMKKKHTHNTRHTVLCCERKSQNKTFNLKSRIFFCVTLQHFLFKDILFDFTLCFFLWFFLFLLYTLPECWWYCYCCCCCCTLYEEFMLFRYTIPVSKNLYRNCP